MITFVSFNTIVDIINVSGLKKDQFRQSSSNIHPKPGHGWQRVVNGRGHHGAIKEAVRCRHVAIVTAVDNNAWVSI